MEKEALEKLKQYFAKKSEVRLAFLYGSSVKDRKTQESDVDIAVFLDDVKKEDSIWQELSVNLKEEVDLIALNDAPATLVSNIIKTGIPLTIKDRKLFWNMYLENSLEAEDFADFAKNYWEIMQRSHSLSPEDRTRLLERIQYLEAELAEIARFQEMDLQEYEEKKSKRREIERWAENIINASIDIAKIILASEKKDMPKTYEEALYNFAIFAGLSRENAQIFSSFARLRNILAHEYLDILYEKIRNLIENFPLSYKDIGAFLRKYIDDTDDTKES